VPPVTGTQSAPAQVAVAGTTPTLPWPAKGSAAVAVQGLGIVARNGSEEPLPIASVTKVMTAYVILTDKPLKPGEQGPSITFTAADETLYRSKLSQNESVVPVKAGQQLTEYQVLQGLLIPSGNNLGDALANWDAGSVEAFVAKMNAAAKELDLKKTTYADTSGALEASVSNPADQVVLIQKAMANPVFADIVKQPEVTLPGIGRFFNVDSVLGQDGIVGVKTGSYPTGLANFTFAATTRVGGKDTLVFGAVFGLETLAEAFDASRALIRAAAPAITRHRVLTAGDPVGHYDAPWGGTVNVLAPADVEMLGWPGMSATTRVELRAIAAPAGADSPAGSLVVTLGEQRTSLDLKTSGPIPEPTKSWRLTRH
jgi:D-alanyl-D-alanine carboxypeptidase (penicillin-binding protein 5/6)